MIKLVIFDLDDTLISEKEYIKSGFSCVADWIEKTFHIENVFNDLLRLFQEDSKMVFNRFFELKKIQYSKEDIEKLIEIYRTHKPHIEFYSDVIPTIQKLREEGKKLAILSDGYVETQVAKIQVLKANELFDEILLTDSLGKEYWKPSVRGFELLKETFQVSYDEMLYVGDNPEKDFYISKMYPIHTMRIIRENAIYKDAKYLEGIREEMRVTSLMEGRYE